MGKVEIMKQLDARRRKGAALNKSMVSHIQYQGDIRRQIDRDMDRAERSRIKGQLSKAGSWHPQLMRDRYEELTKNVGQV